MLGREVASALHLARRDAPVRTSVPRPLRSATWHDRDGSADERALRRLRHPRPSRARARTSSPGCRPCSRPRSAPRPTPSGSRASSPPRSRAARPSRACRCCASPSCRRCRRPIRPSAASSPSRPPSFGRLFTSPGPIFEPETARPDPWRGARALHAVGFRPGDVVLNTFSYHLTPGGFIMDGAARALGCAVIPAGPGNTDSAARGDRGLPAERLLRHAGLPEDPARRRPERRPRRLSCLQRALCSGAAFPKSLQDEIAARGIDATQAYATADLGFIAYETSARDGHGGERGPDRRDRPPRHGRSGAGGRGRRDRGDVARSRSAR